MPFSNDEVIIVPQKSKLKTFVLVISCGLFVASLFNVAFCSAKDCWWSFAAFLTGAIGFTIGAGVSWLANPLLFLSWLLILRHKRGSMLFSLLAVLMSLSFLTFHKITVNEAGGTEDIISIGRGYWLWLASCIATFISSVLLSFLKRKKKQ